MKFLIVSPKGLIEPLQDIVESANKIKNLPNAVIFASVFASYSAIIQFFTDIIIEILATLGLFIKMPFRPDFLFLAALSALLSHQTLTGLRKLKIDLTQEAIQVALLIEFALIVSDLYFIFTYSKMTKEIIVVRVVFIFLTFVNFIIFNYIMFSLRLFQFKIITNFIEFFYVKPKQKIFKRRKNYSTSDSQSQ